MANKRKQGEQNELKVLHRLAVFGWLTSWLIAILIFPRSTEKSAEKMASRVADRLLKKREISKRELKNGVPFYTLTASGAKRIRDEKAVKACTGKYIRARNDVHRIVANLALIYLGLRRRLTIIPEYKIQKNKDRYTLNNRLPDGLIFMDEQSMQMFDGTLTWVEAENSDKGNDSLNRIAEQAIGVARGDVLHRNFTVGEVGEVMVVCPKESNVRRVIAAVEREMLKGVSGHPLSENDVYRLSMTLRIVRVSLTQSFKMTSIEEVSPDDISKFIGPYSHYVEYLDAWVSMKKESPTEEEFAASEMVKMDESAMCSGEDDSDEYDA